MKLKNVLMGGAILATGGLAITAVVQAQTPSKASFFVTSVGKGKGADLGGLAGADAHCADLAKKAGLVRGNWRAYLSATATKDKDNAEKRNAKAIDTQQDMTKKAEELASTVKKNLAQQATTQDAIAKQEVLVKALKDKFTEIR